MRPSAEVAAAVSEAVPPVLFERDISLTRSCTGRFWKCSDNLNKFKLRETTRVSDILAEQVYMFEDPDFWGRDNIIKPDESIEAAIDRLSRRLKRRM